MPLHLIAPGQRKGNKFFLARGRIAGQLYEISTDTTDQKAAERRKKELEADIQRAVAQAIGSRGIITFEQLARRYIEFRNPTREDRRRLERVIAVIGQRNFREIKGTDIHAVANEIGARLEPQSRNRNIMRPIISVLHYAYHAELWDHWIRVKTFKEPEPQPRALDADTAAEVISAADPQMYRLLKFLFLHGTRIRKTLDLTWDQIDLKRFTFRLFNAKGERWETFAIHDDFIALLGPKGDGKVFPYTNYSQFYRALQKLNARTGIYFTAHMARHTLGTMMALNREPLKAIMQTLGHTTPMMSLRYQKADVEMVRGAINRVKLPHAKIVGRAS